LFVGDCWPRETIAIQWQPEKSRPWLAL
jgi:hypothetical protein